MKITSFNANNKGHESGKYPLFLGEQLGLTDTINITYPELEALYNIQTSQIWNELEISLIQDKQDMLHVAPDTVDLMVKTISWQYLADSMIARSISNILMPHITNPELENLVNAWAFFETIHARAYSHIVKQTFVDPTQLLYDTYNSYETIVRSSAIQKALDGLGNLPQDASIEEKRDAITVVMAAALALESIAFMSSFAVTFAIGETGAFQGICQEITLIMRDEILHQRMAFNIIDILKKDPAWKNSFIKNEQLIKDTLDAVVSQELEWADYLFSEGRQVVGLTAALLKEYTQYIAKPIYDGLGIKYDFETIESNPCPYMNKYIDSGSVQVAPQEIQITAYKIGAVKDDTDDMNFDFDF